jgi:hypothetical protein
MSGALHWQQGTKGIKDTRLAKFVQHQAADKARVVVGVVMG